MQYVAAARAFDRGDMEECLEQFFRAIHSRYDIEKPAPRRLIRRKLGVKAEVGLPQISEGVYLDMGALLTLKGAKIDGGSAASIKFNPYYLEIPVHIGYKYAVNENFAIFGNAGPYLAIGLFGKAKAEGDILDEYEFDDNSTNVFGDDAMKRFDFGLGLKAGVEFSQKYQISIGYDWGLVENIKDSGNKNRNLMISLSCFF